MANFKTVNIATVLLRLGPGANRHNVLSCLTSGPKLEMCEYWNFDMLLVS